MAASTILHSLIDESQNLEHAGNIAGALRQARRALQTARATGNDEATAVALVRMAHVHFRQGHYDQAGDLAEQALAQAGQESSTRVDAWLIQGLCAAETDDPAAAETLYHRAIDLARQLGYHRALVRALHNLAAGVYVPRGQFELALAADQEALRLAQEHDMGKLAWVPLATMGWVHWVTGQHEQALATAQELRCLASVGSLAEGFYDCLRADLAQDDGEAQLALSLYSQARSIAEAFGDPGLNVLLRLGLSRWQRAAGNASSARDWADDALAFAVRVGYRHLQGMALIERGRSAWQGEDLSAAEQDFRAAMEVLEPLQAAFDLARAALLLAALLHRQADDTAGAAWLDAARRIASGDYAFLLEQERALALPLVAAYLNDADAEVAALSATLLTHLGRVPPAPLRIHTLGRFAVRQGSRLVPDHAWRPRRAGELFRLLLISRRRTLARDQIIEALWPDKPPASAQALLHQATSALRRALEPDLPGKFPSRYLLVEEGQVELRLPAGSWVDFEAFEQHLEREEWEAALALYEGDLFPADRYADWPTARRERLRQQAIRVALAVARQRLDQGKLRLALEACRRALALEPWQEEAVLLGMRAYVALNDRGGAIRLYRELEHRLQQDLGIAPQADVQAFYYSLFR